jgi:hypothetical protein
VFTAYLSPFFDFSIPLGSPKYDPELNSLTIIISRPETMLGFKEE